EDEGGWVERETALAFANYADLVTARLGDRVQAWATLNEPWCSAYLGYTSGEHAPGRRDRRAGLQASHNLLLAHGLALPLMRRNAPSAQHGIVLNLNPAYPASDSEADRAAAKRYDGFFNRWYLDPLLRGRYPADVWEGYGSDVPKVEEDDLKTVSAPLDFLGVNFYSRSLLAKGSGDWPAVEFRPPGNPVTAMGWEVYPAALTELLLRLQRDYSVPELYITENGAAYPDRLVGGKVDDRERIAYLDGHIRAVEQALAAGVPVKGYFAWSLLDNFEWAHGFEKRFGLVHVDYVSQERTLKESAKWYGRRVSSGAPEPVG
ncbi:MAG TPA: family 1 glycosylhydrolase, partial [Trueperaceae bacterium]